MKTSLDIPEELMTDVRVFAAREGRRIKDVVSESLRMRLAAEKQPERPSVREIEPVSVERIIDLEPGEDRLEGMLDERGHRY